MSHGQNHNQEQEQKPILREEEFLLRIADEMLILAQALDKMRNFLLLKRLEITLKLGDPNAEEIS